MNNIILIGMPSSGKSTVGVLLAKALGYRFLDTDLLIQEKTGQLLHELISEKGKDAFLALEDRLLSEICAERTVIATGGSAVYGKEAMAHLRSLGTVIYLKIDLDTLAARLGDYTHRGVVQMHGNDLPSLFAERTPLYEQYADCTVDEALLDGDLGRTMEAVLSTVSEKHSGSCR